MEVNKHVGYNVKTNFELTQYLEDNGIPYNKGEIVLSFHILESNPHWGWINEYLHENGLKCLSDTIFSEEELTSAKWLKLRSKWHNGYPQPEGNFGYEKGITYVRENYCKKCGTGVRQIDSFRLKKQPKWGKRFFFMLNWVEDELFVSDSARRIIERSDLTGVQFRDVKNKKGDSILEDVWQMEIPYVIQKGIIPKLPTIDDVCVCPECGIPKYHTSGIGMLTYKKEVFDGAPDFVKTSEVFGWGSYAPKEIVVSQKVYCFLKENKMDASLVFEPIELV